MLHGIHWLVGQRAILTDANGNLKMHFNLFTIFGSIFANLLFTSLIQLAAKNIQKQIPCFGNPAIKVHFND